VKARLVVYSNSDDALLQWTVDSLDDHTIGFAIRRKLSRPRQGTVTDWLDNYSPPGPGDHQRGEHRSSEVWPFRSFSWTDHSVDPGDKVSYRVVPVLASSPALRDDMASEWSETVAVGAKSATPYSAYFNRGFVISQFVSRYLDDHYPGLTRTKALDKLKDDIGTNFEDEMRAQLSGQVREAMLGLLADVQRGKGHIYAALFELGDDQLIKGLEALGPRAHVVLANGSIEVKKDKNDKPIETTAEARKRDENKPARKRLIAKRVDVEEANRFVSPGSLAHNKFVVVTTAAGEARRVWTGSTNWTTTGLCTQLNNGLLVEDPAVADLYLKQWHALRDAGSSHPPELATSNGTPGEIGDPKPGDVRASVRFTRDRQRVDLGELGEIVRGTNEGLLFLMFIPGGSGVLADVLKLAADKPSLLVRGVVSQLPDGRQDEKTGTTTTLRTRLVGAPGALAKPQTYNVVQPQGMPHPAAGWAVETTRNQFLGEIGHAIIHSKVLVVDPFSDDPTVVTGSHNFSISASGENDENFIVVRGDRALAEAYAVNVDSAWRHYAGRAGRPYPRLRGVDYLRALWTDQRREARFWKLTAEAL
jgi:phosphatidylserine/phosphatidylglycerophosphate/cardiolipin synthase-like enzyme